MTCRIIQEADATIAVQAVQQTIGTADSEVKKEDAVKRLAATTNGALSLSEIDSLLHDASSL